MVGIICISDSTCIEYYDRDGDSLLVECLQSAPLNEVSFIQMEVFCITGICVSTCSLWTFRLTSLESVIASNL